MTALQEMLKQQLLVFLKIPGTGQFSDDHIMSEETESGNAAAVGVCIGTAGIVEDGKGLASPGFFMPAVHLIGSFFPGHPV